MKRLDASQRFRRTAPARGLEAEPGQRRRRMRPNDAKAHDADRDFARRRLVVDQPLPLTLLRIVEPLPPVMRQHMQRDICATRATGTAGRAGSANR